MPLLSGRHDGRKILLRAAVLDVRDPNDLTAVTATALLDTGATCSAIGPRIVTELGLVPHEKRLLRVATEDRLVEYYFFRVGLFAESEDDAIGLQLPFVFAEVDGFGMRDAGAFELIIGMDVLSQTDFAMDRNGRWTLDFG